MYIDYVENGVEISRRSFSHFLILFYDRPLIATIYTRVAALFLSLLDFPPKGK